MAHACACEARERRVRGECMRARGAKQLLAHVCARALVVRAHMWRMHLRAWRIPYATSLQYVARPHSLEFLEAT